MKQKNNINRLQSPPSKLFFDGRYDRDYMLASEAHNELKHCDYGTNNDLDIFNPLNYELHLPSNLSLEEVLLKEGEITLEQETKEDATINTLLRLYNPFRDVVGYWHL